MRRVTRSGSRRVTRTDWQGALIVNTTGTMDPGDESEWFILPEARQTELTSPTILRIRGQLWVSLEEPGDGGFASQFCWVGLGIGVWNKGLSTVASPDPLEDLSFGWMWHHSTVVDLDVSAFSIDSGTAAGAGTIMAPHGQFGAIERIDVDVKAMRVLREDDRLKLKTKVDAAGAGSASIRGVLRVLVGE